MFADYRFTVAERFLRYVQIDTQADPHSTDCPSSPGQKILGALLVDELREAGATDAGMDDNGYVYATIPSNVPHPVPVICFCSHLDTAPDCSGSGVRPLIHWQYDGSPIMLPDDPLQVITMEGHPYLREKLGEDIITASGKTLLGADDKAGVAIIMDATHYLLTHPQLPHGEIRILFTPDEEIGRGVDRLDLNRLKADFAYTLDAGERGTLEEETFSADGVTITIHGISAHPGQAKNKMVNALKVAAALLSSLPTSTLAPEATEGREGFVHPVSLQGTPEKAELQFIIRDFETRKLAQYEHRLQELLQECLHAFPGSRADFEVKEQYRNMKEVLVNHPQVTAHAVEAIRRAGMQVIVSAARGGTDGSRLSFMGLPCPNIFTGEMAFHGKQEYVSIQDMQKSVETVVHLANIWSE